MSVPRNVAMLRSELLKDESFHLLVLDNQGLKKTGISFFKIRNGFYSRSFILEETITIDTRANRSTTAVLVGNSGTDAEPTIMENKALS